MKVMIRRSRQLEAGLIPRVDHRTAKAAAILQERRRARFAASGQTPEEELDGANLRLPPGTGLSWAQTLRYALQLKRDRERTRETQGAAEVTP